MRTANQSAPAPPPRWAGGRFGRISTRRLQPKRVPGGGRISGVRRS